MTAEDRTGHYAYFVVRRTSYRLGRVVKSDVFRHKEAAEKVGFDVLDEIRERFPDDQYSLWVARCIEDDVVDGGEVE